MNTLEQSVDILTKMYRCRKTAKFLFCDEYKSKVQLYIDIIREVMKNNKCNEVQSVIAICKDPEIASNETSVIMLMSACLEISEP